MHRFAIVRIEDVLAFIVIDLVWLEDDVLAFISVFIEAKEHRGTGTTTGIFSADVEFSFGLEEYDDEDDDEDDDDDADVEDDDDLRLVDEEDDNDDKVDLE